WTHHRSRTTSRSASRPDVCVDHSADHAIASGGCPQWVAGECG
ncbi:MAG: hypothetical protein AVDCRST_MAG21-1642, partial [uncultured Nocardioidaceae bacterium]